MTDKPLLVEGCDYCKFFTHPKSIKTKLFYPKLSEINKDTEFIIIRNGNHPMIIYKNHVTSLSKEQWGRVLYRSRKLFGGGVRLKLNYTSISDHWHAKVLISSKVKKSMRKLPDMRKR
jgi:hypothetical protein